MFASTNYTEADILLILILVLVSIVVGLGLILMPGKIASKRKHSKKDAIWVCNIVGIFLFPCWIIALIWAFTENNNKPVKSFDLQKYRNNNKNTIPPPPPTVRDEFGNIVKMP